MDDKEESVKKSRSREDEFSHFINWAHQHSIDEILTELGKFYKADRSYIFEDDSEKHITCNTYEWCNTGVTPQIDNLRELSTDGIKELENLIEDGNFVCQCVDTLDKSQRLYQILKPQNIDSLILIPLMINDQLSGYIGVDNPRANSQCILLLQIAASIICSKILFKRQLAVNKESYLVLSKIRDQYMTLYYADFTTDYMHTYKTSKNYSAKYGNTEHYSTSMGSYVHNDIAAKDRKRCMLMTSPKYVMERLKKEDSFIIDFEDDSFSEKHYCQLRYIKVNEKGSQVIICGSDHTEEKKRDINLHNQLKRQLNVINAVGSEYDNLFLINVKTKEYTQFNKDRTGMHKAVLDMTTKFTNYEDGLNAYFTNFTAKEEQKYLLEHSTTQVLLSETPEHGINSISYNRMDGSKKIHYQMNTAKFTDEDGTVYLVIGFRNIHAIVEEEERKSAELAEMKDIISAANMGTWHIELIEGKAPRMTADYKMRELLGIAQKDLSPEEVYSAWYDNISPDAVQSVQNSVNRMKDGVRDENTYLWIHPILGERYVRCGGTALKVDRGYILRGYHYDVDEIVREQSRQAALLKEALSQAENASQAKTTFLNNVSHDIRTPMNAIIGYTELAKKHADNKALVKDYLSKIATSSSHLLSLINDVLDMSRIESGRVKIEEKETSLSDIIYDIRTITSANLTAKNLSFFIDSANVTHNNILCDKLRFEQVLLNIVSNATKFTPDGGSVSFIIQEKKCKSAGYAHYTFSIRDTGIGISEEFQKHIFEPFTRENSSTVSGIQGTGLGMAISKNIIDMMGGTIAVKSKERSGTEFTVSVDFKLNMDNDDSAEQSDSDTSLSNITEDKITEDFSGKRILLAEDNKLNQEITVEILKQYGFIIDVADDGDIAVQIIKDAPKGFYDIVLMDVQMPHLNGYEATRQIRSLKDCPNKDIPIIAMTANAFDEDRQQAAETGMGGYISKPIDVPSMLKTIGQFII